MSKIFVRLSIPAVAIYMVICHISALLWQINLWSHTYTVVFELCLCLCITAQGRYHCKYMRWTAYAVCLNDAVISTDELFDFLTYDLAVLLPIIIIAAGLMTTVTLAARHYMKVKRLKRIWKPKKN